MGGSGEHMTERRRTADLRVQLRDREGTVVGSAVLRQVPDGVIIRGRVAQLAAGEHGMHIHQTAACAPPDFQSAGPHFNPTGAAHGVESPGGPHLGDLGNLVVDSDGEGKFTELAQGVTITPGPRSLLSAGGTSLVIHAGPDDRHSDPSGRAGAAIACGEIRH
jgi:Cu-Zn family superoxide dismutase